MPDLRHLVIVTHVCHYRHRGSLYAYAPYAREIEIWADLFPQVVIAAPLSDMAPPRDCAPLDRANIAVAPQPEIGGNGVWRRTLQVLRLPGRLRALHRALRFADAVHVRCPGDLGLLGVLLAPFYTRCLVAKYAGQWSRFPGEAWTTRIQKCLLASRWWNGPTTVYGSYPNQPGKVVSLFTSMLDEQQMERATRAANRVPHDGPLRILFVGRLSRAKNANVLIEAASALKSEGVAVRATIVGEGPERPRLTLLRHELGVDAEVEFAGGLDFDEVLDRYASSDALVLASETEGWPKVVAEAMAFGTICIASDRAFIREMLGAGRGVLVPPGDSAAVTAALRHLACHPREYAEMRRAAAAWSHRYSRLELREALRALLSEHWKQRLEAPANCVSPALRS